MAYAISLKVGPMKAEPQHVLPLLFLSVLILIQASSVVGWTRVLPLSLKPRSPWNSHQQSNSDQLGRLNERHWEKYQKSGPRFDCTLSLFFPSRISCKASADDIISQQSPETIFLSGRLIGSLSEKELPDLIKLVESIPVADQCFVRFDNDDEERKDAIRIKVPADKLPHGATGRAVIIELSLSLEDIAKSLGDSLNLGVEEAPGADEVACILEGWKAMICQYIDEILYSDTDNSCFQQPILFSVASQTNTRTEASTPESDIYYQDQLLAMIQEQVRDYGLVDDMEKHHEIVEIPATDPTMFVPSYWYEVDGAMVTDNKQEKVWDTSTVLVFDNLLESASEERSLRKRMLDVVLGNTSDDEEREIKQQRWDDAKNGPDPSRWEAGALLDLPDTDGDPGDPNDESDMPESFGLTDVALEEICEESPPPTVFQEFESILSRLFPDFVVCRLPEAVLGGGVTPLTANAPCFGQSFDYHIDADPYSAPPSPWTDVYGRYANRATGKPRFVSCLIYVNDDWDGSHWGAPTRFLDVATDTEVDIVAKPGRVVLMDQDITHTVVAPSEGAGKRPRYSLVWKLVLHPRSRDQNMRDFCSAHNDWPTPLLVGSAKR